MTSTIDLLARMVRINSVNQAASKRPAPETPLAIELESIAAELGLQTKRLDIEQDRFNLLVHGPTQPQLPWLVFESHLDTVAIDGMSIDPLGAAMHDGKMFGRGACDTKASGAAMLSALATTNHHRKLANNTAVLFTLDEEVGKLGATAFVTHHLPKLGWRPSLIIVGEPTLMQPILAHNGVLRWTIETRGKSVHSSRPELGRSAISDMVRVIEVLERRYIAQLDLSHPLTGKAQCSINLISGGSQINVIPESCTIQIDRRILPGENPNTIIPAVETLLQDLRDADPELQVTQKDIFIDPAMSPINAESILHFLSPSLESRNIPCQPAGAPYGTNASNYTEVGIPSVVLGPGDIAQAHTKDEWIALSQIELAVEIYSELMQQSLPRFEGGFAGDRSI